MTLVDGIRIAEIPQIMKQQVVNSSYTGRSPGHAVGMAGCGHSKIARMRTYYLYCMCLAVLTSV